MGDQKLIDILANLAKTNQMTSRPSFGQVTGLSNAILSGAPLVQPYDSGAVKNANDARGPSFVSRVLDILSRPEYAVLSGIQGAVDRSKAENPTGESSVLGTINQELTPDAVKDFWAGLSGKSKITGKEILEKNNIGEDWSGPAKAATAFGIDIVADPLTWIDGVGLPAKVAKKLGFGKDAESSVKDLADVEQGTAKTSQGLADQIAQLAGTKSQDTQGLLDLVKSVDKDAAVAKQASTPVAKIPKAVFQPADDLLEDVPKAVKDLDFEAEVQKLAEQGKASKAASALTKQKEAEAAKLLRKAEQEKAVAARKAEDEEDMLGFGKVDELPATGEGTFGKPIGGLLDKITEVGKDLEPPTYLTPEQKAAWKTLTPPEGLSPYAARMWMEDEAKHVASMTPISIKAEKAEKLTDKIAEEVPKEAKGLPPAELLDDIEDVPKAVEQIKVLNKQIESTKSPITKSILKSQVQKLAAGVKPADVLDAARVNPPAFPGITINARWIADAQRAATEFLKGNRLSDINHIGQSNLYNKILNAASKVRQDRRAFTVFQMLRIAEDQVLAAGRHLTDADGLGLRLSDVANLMGGPKALTSRMVDDFRNAKPTQLVEALKASNTAKLSSKVIAPIVQTAQQIAPAVAQLPPSQTAHTASELSKALSKIAQNAGASTREAKTAKAFIDELFSPERDKLYSKVEQQARGLVRQTATGQVNPTVLSNVSNAVYATLGANPKVLGRALDQSKVVEGIMTKFATWWGARDLRPFARQYIDTARNVAAAFAETIKPLVRSTTKSQRQISWAVATGKQTAGSVQEQALADEFKKIVERLMGTHGITDNSEAVVMRSGTVMKELNDALPKEMQFTAAKGTDELGRAFDYTKGNWMDSWKEWKATEPAETLYKLTRGLQTVTRKNAMWDDAAARWGLPVKGAEYQHQVFNIPRLSGTYFPKQIAEQLTNLQKQLDRDVFKTPHKAIELFDKVQRMWKTGVTVYSPSHHVRNLNGDVYLSALDGVTSPRPYFLASKVLHSFPTRFKSLEDVFNIMDPKLREAALTARPTGHILTTKGGVKLTAEQIYQAAESQGILTRANNLEELAEDASVIGSKFKPFGGKVYDAATHVSELREHWVRLAHFIDVLSKSKGPLAQSIETAGRRVRKFHPDGMDLTGFEQNVLRRVIPFYSWMRKATPLVIEGALMHPAVTLAYPKLMSDAQEITGIESQGPADPFPMDQMFPEWLKDKGIGPILGPDSGLGRQDNWRGHAPGDTIINPSNPFLDQLQQIGNPGQTILGGLTPAARVPLELLMGQTSLGIPTSSVEGGVPGYLLSQIPAAGIAGRVTGLTRDNEPYNPEQLINWLTGLGVTGTGPYQQQGQTEIRDALAKIASDRRGDYK